MKIGEVKETENGELDVEIIFESKEEKILYAEMAEKEGLSLHDFFIKMVDEMTEEKLKDGK